MTQNAFICITKGRGGHFDKRKSAYDKKLRVHVFQPDDLTKPWFTCTPSKLKWTPTMLLLSTCTTYNTHLVHQRNSHHPLTIKSSFLGGQYERKMIETQVLTKHCISGLPLTSKEWPWTSYFTAFIHVVYRQIDHCILKRIWSSEQGEYFHYFHVHDFRVSKKKCRLKIMVLQIPP